MSRRRRRLALGAFVLLLASLAVSCSSDPNNHPGPVDPSSALAENLEGGAGTYNRMAKSLVELLPNAVYDGGGRASDSVIVGEFVSYKEGASYDQDGGGPAVVGGSSAGAAILDFDDPAAEWRTIRVTFSVIQVVAGQQVDTLTVDWPLLGNSADGDDAVAVTKGLKALGRVVVISKKVTGGPEQLGLQRRIADPAFGIGTLGPNGVLSFPFDDDAVAGFTGGINTLSELKIAATKADWTVN